MKNYNEIVNMGVTGRFFSDSRYGFTASAVVDRLTPRGFYIYNSYHDISRASYLRMTRAVLRLRDNMHYREIDKQYEP